MIRGVYTPDGKFTEVLADVETSPVQVAAVVRMCVERDAVDVLPMLGVGS